MVDSTPERKTWPEKLRAFGIRWFSYAIGVVIADQVMHAMAQHYGWLVFFFESRTLKESLLYGIIVGFGLAFAPVKREPNMLIGRNYYVTIDGKRQKKKMALTPKPKLLKPIRRASPTVERM